MRMNLLLNFGGITTVVALITTLVLWYNISNNYSMTLKISPNSEQSFENFNSEKSFEIFNSELSFENFNNEQSFENFNNESGTKNGEYIVPNIIHYLRFQKNNLTFVDAVCILSAFKNHRPDKILFHTDAEGFVGPYWEKVKNTPGLVYEIHNVMIPDQIFGQKYSIHHFWYASDVTRIRILMIHGGIFLDNDTYVVRSLNDFRRYEMTIAWEQDHCLDNQVIIAHKNARFLRLWLESYRKDYTYQWYYKDNCKQTDEILRKKPELVHRVKLLFGVHKWLPVRLYKNLWTEWRNQYTIHLQLHQILYLKNGTKLKTYRYFNEENIKDYPMTFGVMAREVYGLS